MKKTSIFLALIAMTSALFAGTYNLDIAHSHVSFKARHMMISTVEGQFDKFSGNFVYDNKTKKLISVKGTADVNSIDTKVAKRDAHLKSSDFFDAAKYPTLTFVSTKIEGDTVYGKLTMRGVTKDIKLHLEVAGTITDPWGNVRTGLSLSGKVNRLDYGLKWNKVMEAGGVLVGDIIKIDIGLEGIEAK
ncbi:MAG: YceI family protein [Sulfurospirillaceae bacterium]|nr:YceI family protein [Sulfurospirillaceae bacterium]